MSQQKAIAERAKEQKIIQESIKAIDVKFTELQQEFFNSPEDPDFPFGESQALTQGAAEKSLNLMLELKENKIESPDTNQEIIDDLSKALELMNQDQQQQEQDSDGESEEGEESDEYEESDEEGEEGDDEAMPDSSKMDLGRQELPPPAKNPQDIIKMEQELQKIREANKKPAKRSKVEKDW